MPLDSTHYHPIPPPAATLSPPTSARHARFVSALAQPTHSDPPLESAVRVARINALFDDGEDAPAPTLCELTDARLDARDEGYEPTAEEMAEAWADLRDYLRSVV